MWENAARFFPTDVDALVGFRHAVRLEEATIDELHAAIKAGAITCVQIVQHYIDRARAYNGRRECAGHRRRQTRRTVGRRRPCGCAAFLPTATVNASTLFPDLDKYKGKPSSTAAWNRPRRTPRCSSSTG